MRPERNEARGNPVMDTQPSLVESVDTQGAESEMGWEEWVGEGEWAEWAGLPQLVLVELAWLLGERERAALGGTCAAWRAAEQASWSAVRSLAPRAWIPRFLHKAQGTAHFPTLQALVEKLGTGPLDKLGKAKSLRTLDLSVGREAGPPRLMSVDGAGVAGLASLWSLAGVTRLDLRDVVFGDAELGALSGAMPRVTELRLSLGLYVHHSSPHAQRLQPGQPSLSAAEKRGLLGHIPLADQLKGELTDLDVLLLIAVKPFSRIRRLRLDHGYLAN